MAQAEKAQTLASKGIRSEYYDYLHDPRRAGNVMARAFRGAPPLTPGSSTALRQRAQGVTRGVTRAKPTPAAPRVVTGAMPAGKMRRPVAPSTAIATPKARKVQGLAV
jgi:hypothetical protein